MHIPATLTPETAAWLRVQTTIAASHLVQPLERRIDELEGFNDSMFVMLAQLVPAILEASPEVADRLAPIWRRATERYEAIAAGAQPLPDDEPVAHLEARMALYHACNDLGLWSPLPRARVARRTMRRGRCNH